MSTFLKKIGKKSIVPIFIVSLLYVFSGFTLETYFGVCLQTYQSKRVGRTGEAYIGIDENGKRRVVRVYLSRDKLPTLGTRVQVSKRLFDYGYEKVVTDQMDKSKYLFTGQLNRFLLGEQVPLGNEVNLEVIQGGKEINYQMDGRHYFIELQNDKDATLIFSCEGYKTKKLYLPKVNQNKYQVFRANCVFEEGKGTTERTMNLDSLARAS